MTLYYAKGTSQVIAIHADDQLLFVEPVITYGFGAYVIIDKYGPAAVHDPTDPFQMKWLYPTITVPMQNDSVRAECQFRIYRQIGPQVQQNIVAHTNSLQQKQLNGQTLTTAEQSDLTYAFQIFQWIGRPTGMQGASDSLIAANDTEWWLDGKWPPWNSVWDAFVARF